MRLPIRFDPVALPLSKLAALLSSIGYTPDFSMDKLDGPEGDIAQQAAVSEDWGGGFLPLATSCLFSLPEYLAGTQGVDAQFRTLFGALNIILALPVFLYSSLDFFKPAWLSVRQRQWSMDIAIFTGYYGHVFSGVCTRFQRVSVPVIWIPSPCWCSSCWWADSFRKKTYDSLSFERDYRSYFPLSVIRLREDGSEESIAATQIAENDRVVIRNGELLPADAILLDDHAAYGFQLRYR